MQGDPQYITKQRVETAIRVILDLLRMIPATPSSPQLHPSLTPYVLRDASGNPISSLERVGTFRAIRLQAGTTTKVASKKQLSAGPTPREALLYLEAAVYMSGENGRRVYACRRCRLREAKRRQSKDASRKKPAESSDNEPLPKRSAPISTEPPSLEYITGENPDQYDPMRGSQRVEEPAWNPSHPDWRHEVILFNSPPEVQISDGSCVWLPFRVVCYGKCHGEKVGFRIKFTLRNHTGAILATSITAPIRITDDHKTDAKSKPKGDAVAAAPQPPAPRSRKHRQSTASSHRVSPDPSDAESVQSRSEAGAMMQKQTPSVRNGKPYERPASLHDNASRGLHNFPSFPQNGGMLDLGANGTVSPGVLRQPSFFNGSSSNAGSIAASTPGSNLTSPVSATRPLESHIPPLFSGEVQAPNFNSAFASLHVLEEQQRLYQQQQQQNAGYKTYSDGDDLEMSNAIATSLDNIFDTSSHASLSSFNDDGASVFSANLPEGSLFSDSGVVPDDMQGFLDFTGGQGDAQITQPPFFGSPNFQSSPNNHTAISPQSLTSPSQLQPGAHDLLAQFSRSQDPTGQNHAQSSTPIPSPMAPHVNAPTISTIIPAEGPMAGGTTVAIIGANFSPGVVVMFGDRTARLERVDPTFIQCQSPPAAAPGIVEVSIAGAVRNPGAPPMVFKYNMMDTDL